MNRLALLALVVAGAGGMGYAIATPGLGDLWLSAVGGLLIGSPGFLLTRKNLGEQP